MDGAVVSGKYRLAERIGAGATSVVYAGVHVGTGRDIAIKRLLPTRANDDATIARFEREARTAGSIRSEHVVEILDVGRDEEGLPYLVLERLFGETLEARLEKRGRLPLAEALAIVDQVLEGVADLHDAGVVHRDLKPANIYLTQREGKLFVKLVDLGVAKVSQASLDAEITRTDETIGTLAYMAPEQIKRNLDASPAADLWSVGVILYRMVTAKNPFTASDPMSLVAAILEQPAPRLPAGIPCGEALQAVLDRTLAKEPAARHPSAKAMAEDLRRIFSGEAPRGEATNGARAKPERSSLTDEEPTRPQPVPSSIPPPFADDTIREAAANRGRASVPPPPALPAFAAPPRAPESGNGTVRLGAAVAVALGLAAGWIGAGRVQKPLTLGSLAVEADPPDAKIEFENGRARVAADGRDARVIDLPDRPGVTVIVHLPHADAEPTAPSAAPSASESPRDVEAPAASVDVAAPPAPSSDAKSGSDAKEEHPAGGARRVHAPAQPSLRPTPIYKPPY